MKNMTLRNIADVTQGQYFGDTFLLDVEVTMITTDSRKVEKGGIFVAIKGERSDGHDYIQSTVDSGAICVISEKTLSDGMANYIKVKSSLDAIKAMARLYRESLSLTVVGITGSVGKTSTKEMVASVLSQRFTVLKTLGNFNNELGLPLTIFRLTQDDEVAVLEMGISDFGEMHRLSSIAKPDITIMTNIGICHLENLGTRDGILKAKSEIFDFQNPMGEVILNGEDDKLATIKNVGEIIPATFGTNDSCYDAYATDIISRGLKGTDCILHTEIGDIEVHIPIPGKHMVSNALAGAIAGIKLGLTADEIKAGIEKLKPLSGRNNMISTEKYVVIDDCYNANPVSMRASLDVLSLADTRKVAILGDMGELGTDERKLHREVGEYAADAGIELLLCVGDLSCEIEEGFNTKKKENQKCVHFHTVEDLLDKVDEFLVLDDSILVKASHFMKFERIVECLVK